MGNIQPLETLIPFAVGVLVGTVAGSLVMSLAWIIFG